MSQDYLARIAALEDALRPLGHDRQKRLFFPAAYIGHLALLWTLSVGQFQYPVGDGLSPAEQFYLLAA